MTEANRGPAGASSDAELRELAGRLHSTAIRLLRRAGVADRETGLTPARLSALSALVSGGPRSLGELADAEQVTPPTMSRLAGALVDDGLVSREPDPEDGRSVVLRATPEGRRLLEEGRDRRVERLRALLEELGSDELEAARAACSALEGALAPGGTGGEEEPPGVGG